MEKTGFILLTNTQNINIRIEYFLTREFYFNFIKNLSTFYGLRHQGLFKTKIPLKIQTANTKILAEYPLLKNQFNKSRNKLLPIDFPCSFEAFEYVSHKIKKGEKINFFDMTYSSPLSPENILAIESFSNIFLLGEKVTDISQLINIISFYNKKELSFIKRNLVRDQNNIIAVFGKKAYFYLLKLFSYQPIETDYSNYLIDKKFIAEATKNIFAKNNKFQRVQKANLLVTPFFKKNFLTITGFYRYEEPSRDQMTFNFLFSRDTRKIILNVSLPKYYCPKSQREVENYLKNLDSFFYNALKYFENIFGIYKYLINVFKGEILLEKL